MAIETKYTDAYYGVMPDKRDAGGVVCRTGDYVVGSSALDANSMVYMCKVPEGARIMRIDYKVSALGASRTMEVGTPTDDDKYDTAVDVSSAVSGYIIPDNEVLSDDETLVFKVENGTIPAAAEFLAHVWYKMADCIADEAAVAS